MVLHEIFPPGGFFIAVGAAGAAVTGGLIAGRHHGGTKGLVVAAAALAVGLSLLPTVFLGDPLDLLENLKALVPVLAILAAFVGLHRPIDTMGRVARVTAIGAVLGPMLLIGGSSVAALAVIIVLVAYGWRVVRRRQAEGGPQ